MAESEQAKGYSVCDWCRDRTPTGLFELAPAQSRKVGGVLKVTRQAIRLWTCDRCRIRLKRLRDDAESRLAVERRARREGRRAGPRPGAVGKQAPVWLVQALAIAVREGWTETEALCRQLGAEEERRIA